jgi:hypothetical protein
MSNASGKKRTRSKSPNQPPAYGRVDESIVDAHRRAVNERLAKRLRELAPAVSAERAADALAEGFANVNLDKKGGRRTKSHGRHSRTRRVKARSMSRFRKNRNSRRGSRSTTRSW